MCVLKNYLIQHLKRKFFNIGIQNSESIVNNRYFSFISEKKLYKRKDEKNSQVFVFEQEVFRVVNKSFFFLWSVTFVNKFAKKIRL